MSIQKVSSILASRIRTIRYSKGWTQKQLAQKINVTPSYISRIESCQKLPTLPIISNIADTFGIKVYELFVNYFESNRSGYQKKRIINIVRETAPDRIKLYSALLKAVEEGYQPNKR
jgi:transcriptional regulator with XRE-family HTH domain